MKQYRVLKTIFVLYTGIFLCTHAENQYLNQLIEVQKKIDAEQAYRAQSTIETLRDMGITYGVHELDATTQEYQEIAPIFQKAKLEIPTLFRIDQNSFAHTYILVIKMLFVKNVALGWAQNKPFYIVIFGNTNENLKTTVVSELAKNITQRSQKIQYLSGTSVRRAIITGVILYALHKASMYIFPKPSNKYISLGICGSGTIGFIVYLSEWLKKQWREQIERENQKVREWSN